MSETLWLALTERERAIVAGALVELRNSLVPSDTRADVDGLWRRVLDLQTGGVWLSAEDAATAREACEWAGETFLGFTDRQARYRALAERLGGQG